MKIYLIASNKYTHVCPINVHFIDKYWPNQDIVILGYENLENFSFPANVKVEILGKQDDFGKSWTTALVPYFRDLEDEYFVVLIEDLILLKQVDLHKISILENMIKADTAHKAVIGGGLPLQSTTKISENVLLFDQTIDYRCTLHPSIWRKDYFMQYLVPDMTIWDFEIGNNKKAKHDGARIVANNYSYPSTPHPFSTLNLYNRGKLTINKNGEVLDDQPSKRYFESEDIKLIWEKLNNA